MNRLPHIASLVVTASVLLPLTAASVQAGPTVTNVSLRALQAGGTTTLTIDGDSLLPEPRLLCGVPLTSQVVKPGGTAKRVQIDVAIDASVPTGIYQLRVANSTGVSAPVAVAVDRLSQVPFADQVTSLPVAMHGSLAGSTILRTTLQGKAKQRLIVEAEARRIGSALNPVLHIYDGRRVQLAWAQGVAALAGDARIEVELPADGPYIIELHDALYRGGNPGFFRLKLGELQYADLAFPLGIERGKKADITFASANVPEGTTVQVEASAAASATPAPWPAGLDRLSGGRPRVVISELTELIEAPADAASAGLQQTTAPVGLNGRLSKPGEEDRYQINAPAGTALRFDVLASRAGSPLDGVLFIRNDKGGQLATNDDRPGTTDPGLDFTVPAGVNAIVVAIKDLHERGGANFLYRIAVTSAKQPDFTLTVSEDRVEVPLGGSALVRVQATRAGYTGPIKLSLEGLPEGVTTSIPEIPAGASDAFLSFTASELPPTQMLTRLVGQSVDVTPAITRAAEFPETPVNKHQPWLRSELAAAVTDRSTLQLAWAAPSADINLTLGGSLPAQIKVTRAETAKGAIRLTLLTTQKVPTKKVQNKDVEDTDRALRFDGTPTIAADQQETAAKILVPGDLPVMPYDLAIKAELLSADGKNVLATTVTPSQRLTPAKPSFMLELVGEPKLEAKAGSGETGKLTGKLTRQGGFDRPVTLTLAGLPKDVPAPKLVVQGNQTDFTFAVAFPFGTAAAELSGVKLVASSQLDAKTTLAAANEIPLNLKIVPGEKPQSEQPLALFEDQQEFAGNLKEGTGVAALISDDKYSGTLSLRIRGEQRYSPTLPGFGMKIRENPAAGEYRYLQFAWKKDGGQTICLQLGHDGKFGPVDGQPGKFRYHAGPGQECYGGSLAVDTKVPTDWTLVTRDLFADFGEFTLTGLGCSPVDGQSGLFDHLYLGRTPADFELSPPRAAAPK